MSLNTSTNYAHLDTPIGPLLIAGDLDSVHSIFFAQSGKPVPAEPGWIESHKGAVGEAMRQLREYFAGHRKQFDLALSPKGTAFQMAVWRQLEQIPYGETISYQELARRVGNPKASRAVGSANGSNPIPIVIPCHRVIGSSGKLTGFGGGLPIKRQLLDLESGPLLAFESTAS